MPSRAAVRNPCLVLEGSTPASAGCPPTSTPPTPPASRPSATSAPVPVPSAVVDHLQALASGAVPPSVSLSDRWSHFPVAGRLRHFCVLWAALIASPLCNSIVTQGYVPELGSAVPFKPPRAHGRPVVEEHQLPMRRKIAELLRQQIIQPVGGGLRASFDACRGCVEGVTAWVAPPLNAFFHDYFLVPKPDSPTGEKRFRDILNAKPYNKHVDNATFKMEGIRTLQGICQPGDFYVNLDISSAYPHIALHSAYWKHFRMRVPHPDTGVPTDYEYTSLPFGLCSAPRIYSLLSKQVASYLRLTFGIRCVFYLDDWIICGSSYVECQRHAAIVTYCLQSLGFIINAEKSALLCGPDGLVNPIQFGGLFLGLELDLRREHMVLRLPASKRRGMRRALKLWLAGAQSSSFWFSPRSLAQLIGKMVSMKAAVRGAMSHSRTLSRLLKRALRRTSWDSCTLNLSHLPNLPAIVADLEWWFETLASPTANSIKMSHADCSVDTDASPWAWGGFLHGVPCGGFWTSAEREHSSNWKELTGVHRALQYFAKELTNLTVLIQTDNATAVSYLQDDVRGGRVTVLSAIARSIWHHCQRFSIVLRVCHLPGKLNTRADLRSRVSPRSWADCQLNPDFLPRLAEHMGIHHFTVDLFATRENALCPRFFCAEQDPQSSGRDSFLQPWAREISPLAHPPFKLIPRVLDKIRREGSQITLIAPVWGAAWWPQMMGMCRSPPVLLPRAPSLFWGTDKLPRSPPRWETAAFPLCGLTFCSKASRSTPFRPW